MKKIKVRTPAKINLTLEILNKRTDGFHNIQSIMQTVDLYDYLSFEVVPCEKNEIELSGNSNEIPYNDKNLIYKAIVKFMEITAICGYKIKVYIEKNIPVAAGLAGGSTNAAGTLFALNKIFNYPLSKDKIEYLCSTMGSDINFCLNGGTVLCTSRGEITKKLPFFKSDVSLIKPKNLGISAKEAYTKFSQLKDKTNPDFTKKMIGLLYNNEFDKTVLYNSFEKALFPDYEVLRYIKNNLKGGLMSGSGSTFFVLEPKLNFNFNKSDYDIFEGLQTVSTGVEEI